MGGASVLVVEDDASIRELLVAELRAQGFSVVHAADGMEALPLLDDLAAPAVLVLDLMMPRLSGEQLLEVLGARPDAHRFSVVVVSATTDGAHAHSHRNVIRVLQKPFELDELVRAVKRSSSGTVE
jgi:DNA-binding response OmpR family regulator